MRPLLSDQPDAFHLPAIPAYASVRAMALVRQFGTAGGLPGLARPHQPGPSCQRVAARGDRQFNDDAERRMEPRWTSSGTMMQIARPVRPTPDCLTCHGTGRCTGRHACAIRQPARLQLEGGRGRWHATGDRARHRRHRECACGLWRHVVANILVLAAAFVVLNQVLSAVSSRPSSDEA